MIGAITKRAVLQLDGANAATSNVFRAASAVTEQLEWARAGQRKVPLRSIESTSSVGVVQRVSLGRSR